MGIVKNYELNYRELYTKKEKEYDTDKISILYRSLPGMRSPM